MCQIVCKVCETPIKDEEEILELKVGFVEEGEFVPEMELAYFHLSCYTDKPQLKS